MILRGDLFEAYFGVRDAVPAQIAEWLAGRNGSGSLTVETPRGRLVVRLLGTAARRRHHVLLLEQPASRVPGVGNLRQLGLSKREAEVVRLVAAGKDNEHISNKLGVTVGTVRKHLERIYRKLGVNSRAAAATRALAA